MKLFETRELNSTTPVSEYSLNQLKAQALEDLDYSQRAMEAFSSAQNAISLLKVLETHGDNDPGVANIAYEVVNMQLGYPEGSRVTLETVTGSIMDFGRRMWAHIVNAWESVKRWASNSGSYLKSLLKGSPQLNPTHFAKFKSKKVEYTLEQLIEKCVINANITPYAPKISDKDVVTKAITGTVNELIDASSNITNKDILYKLVKEIGDLALTTTLPLPTDMDMLYVDGETDSGYVTRHILASLNGETSSFTFHTLGAEFTIHNGSVARTGTSLENKGTTWQLKEDYIEDLTKIIQIGELCGEINESLIDSKVDKEAIAELVTALTVDYRVYTDLFDRVTDEIIKVRVLVDVLNAANGIRPES